MANGKTAVAGGEGRLFWRIGPIFAKRSTATERHGGRGGVRWRLLELLNIYRIIVAAATIVVAVAPPVARTLQVSSPEAVFAAGIIYLLFALIAIPTLAHERPGLWIQSQLEPIVDLLASAVIVQATGADLGILAAMLASPVAVAAAAATSRKQAVFFAALAALTVLAAAAGSQLSLALPPNIYTEAGLFGLGALALALVSHSLASRLLESEILALIRGKEVRQLDAMNRHIVAQLATGIMVTDASGSLLRTNPAAKRLLDTAGRAAAIRLAVAGKGQRRETHNLKLTGGETRFLTILPLESDSASSRLIFVEDARAAKEQAQSLKLAALGRLTAGMAHQIRNPLSAIVHANQMLAETRGLNERTRRLIAVISHQSARLDAMVEDILALSKPGAARPRSFDLAAWLDGFLADYRDRKPENSNRLKVWLDDNSIETRFDLSHLDHIVTNLLDNAFRHANTPAGVQLTAGKRNGQAFLDVLDRGPGLADSERLFEPFHTTHSAGTGLGLYIARELATANGAWLTATARKGGGTRFHLQFTREQSWLK
ncbi:MAG: sensor histidine kinase [Gammaproteobacteria bacterium]